MSASALASCAGAPSENLRLAKLLRLALVANHDGEAIGAIHALRRALASAGLDGHHIVDAFLRGAQPDTPSISPNVAQDDRAHGDDDADRSVMWWCWHQRERLSPKEREFIESLTRWKGPISGRQRAWLHDIGDRLERGASAS